MEGTATFNPGFLGSTFQWWVGQVAEDSTWRDNLLAGKFSDPSTQAGWGYRYKVRIIGLHDQEETSIPSDQLPWAQVMYPITAGGGQGSTYMTPGIRQGNFVFGFFMDSKDQQVPVIMGVLGNNIQTDLSSTFQNFGPTSGYLNQQAIPKSQEENPQAPDDSLRTSGTPVDTSTVTKAAAEATKTPPPGAQLNKYGLPEGTNLDDIPGGRQSYDVAKQRAADDGFGVEAQEDQGRQAINRILDSIGRQISSPIIGPIQNALIEAPISHLISAADIKKADIFKEKIIVFDAHDPVGSAIKAIQTVIENITGKINIYLDAFKTYMGAVSTTIQNIQAMIANAACEIAKYMKIIMDKIMEYVLKILNKELAKVEALIPLTMRNLFTDIKEVAQDLIVCLYNKLTGALCGLIQSILDDILGLDDAEKRAREQALNNDCIHTTPYVPICTAEDMIARVIKSCESEITEANNSIFDGINRFLDNVQSQLAGLTDQLGDLSNLFDSVVGNITAALNFINNPLSILGCELDANRVISSFYTFGSGAAAQAINQKPSNKSIENKEKTAKPATAQGEDPYVEPTNATSPVYYSGNVTSSAEAGLA